MSDIDTLITKLQSLRDEVTRREDEIARIEHDDNIECLKAIRELHRVGKISSNFVNKTFKPVQVTFIFNSSMDDISITSLEKVWRKEEALRGREEKVA